ncbi:GTP-binding protein REM 2-like [Teleopsis dalmanni]|uniref:GTP-binding protein REM 2-like n=1 Tax=Teleopsis dalmanni TaxID=139649 RepID=UPI0018CCECFC|nr:GTP-binding protein REM 2-like [Teleopsis dalmanni]
MELMGHSTYSPDLVPNNMSVMTTDELEKADAFLVVYSCIDKESFTRAKQILSRLQDMDLLRTRPIILVANKIDLARSRAVSAQDGKCLACTFGAKFIEVSVGINHNCDELLAGTLTQIRLQKDHNLVQILIGYILVSEYLKVMHINKTHAELYYGKPPK